MAEAVLQAVWQDDPAQMVAALSAARAARLDLGDIRARSGATVLCVAVHRGQPNAAAIIKLLLEEAPHLVRLPYIHERYAGETALHLAIARGDGELVAALLAADERLEASAVGLTRLVHAEACGTFFRPPRATYFGGLPLSFAVTEGRFDLALALIQAGARLEAQDSLGNTVLHVAVLKNRVEALLSALPALCDAQAAASAGGPSVTISRLLAIANGEGYRPLALAATQPALAPAFAALWHSSSVPLWRWAAVSASLLPLKSVDPLAGRLEASWARQGRRPAWKLSGSVPASAVAAALPPLEQQGQQRETSRPAPARRRRRASSASAPASAAAALLRSAQQQHPAAGGKRGLPSPSAPLPPEEEDALAQPLSVLEVAVACGNGEVLSVPALQALLLAKWSAYGHAIFRQRCKELAVVGCLLLGAVVGRGVAAEAGVGSTVAAQAGALYRLLWTAEAGASEGGGLPPSPATSWLAGLLGLTLALQAALAAAAVAFLIRTGAAARALQRARRAARAATAATARPSLWRGLIRRYALPPLGDLLGAGASLCLLVGLAAEAIGNDWSHSPSLPQLQPSSTALAAAALLLSFHALSYVALLSPETSSLVLNVFVVWRDFFKWASTAAVLGTGFSAALALASPAVPASADAPALPVSAVVASAPLHMVALFTGQDWLATPASTPDTSAVLALRCMLALLAFVTLSTLQAQMNATWDGVRASAQQLWLLALARRLLMLDVTLSQPDAEAAAAGYEEHDPAETGYWHLFFNYEAGIE